MALISEPESTDISHTEPFLCYLGRVIRIILAGGREASNTRLMLLRLQKLERQNLVLNSEAFEREPQKIVTLYAVTRLVLL